MNQQNQSTKWSFEQLSAAFENTFAELTDAILDGQAPALSDERMEAINLTWFETLAVAKWTYKQWARALDREARYAA